MFPPVFLFLFALGAPMESFAKNKLIAHVFKMPEAVEPAGVTTAGHYILASHLVRSLTKLDKFGKIQGDIAARWEHSADRKTWTIKLAPAQFSDGKPILAADVVASIERQRKFGTGVHFPFAEITGLKATAADEVEIKLREARNDFIYDLSKPEFGVLTAADAARARNELSLAISSGAYYLAKHRGSTYSLKRNPYFKAGVQNELELVMESSEGAASADLLAKGKINFLTTQQNLSFARHKEIAAEPTVRAVKPAIAFSYWLSLNPDSPYFENPAHRAAFQGYVQKFQSSELNGHSWEKATQLYLPDGDGRPSPAALAEAWASIEKNAGAPIAALKKPKLRLVPLKVTNALLDQTIEYLRARYEVEILSYRTEEELIAILKANHFDVKLSSNDFSSIDLSENLKTTFNSSRPYIFVGKNSRVPALLKKAGLTEEKPAQSALFREIGLSLLSEGLIAPLAYQRIWFYYNRDLDTAAWSSIYPEISFWKVAVHD